MPLPEGVTPHPDRPFITVRTATHFHDPDEIRRYATREECLADLQNWQDTSLVRQDPLSHLGVGYRGDDDTYTFEVYENAELRLQLDIDRLGYRQAGPWVTEQSRHTSNRSTRNPDIDGRNAGREAARAWMELADEQSDATAVYDYISNPDEVPPEAKNAIIRTFVANCEEAYSSATPPKFTELERIMRRSLEQHRQTMNDTPERTWETIKDLYASIYEAAGSNIHGIAYQDGFPYLRDLAHKASFAGHYPDQQEEKLQSLLFTLDTQNNRFFKVTSLTRALHGACLQLDHLQELARNLHKQPFLQTEGFFQWLPKRDEIFANLHELRIDPVLKQHLPFLNDLERRLDRIADPALPTTYHPILEAQRNSVDFSPEMQRVADVYNRALSDVHHADLLPYSTAHFGDLQTAVQTAIDTSADNPRQLGSLYALQAQLAISTDRRETARAAVEELTEASTKLVNLKAWSSTQQQPVHQAPGFNAWRDRADEILDRCKSMRTDLRLSPHFQRTGVSDDSVATVFAVLRDSRFQKPPSPEEIAATRRDRQENMEESRGMSA